MKSRERRGSLDCLGVLPRRAVRNATVTHNKSLLSFLFSQSSRLRPRSSSTQAMTSGAVDRIITACRGKKRRATKTMKPPVSVLWLEESERPSSTAWRKIKKNLTDELRFRLFETVSLRIEVRDRNDFDDETFTSLTLSTEGRGRSDFEDEEVGSPCPNSECWGQGNRNRKSWGRNGFLTSREDKEDYGLRSTMHAHPISEDRRTGLNRRRGKEVNCSRHRFRQGKDPGVAEKSRDS